MERSPAAAAAAAAPAPPAAAPAAAALAPPAAPAAAPVAPAAAAVASSSLFCDALLLLHVSSDRASHAAATASAVYTPELSNRRSHRSVAATEEMSVAFLSVLPLRRDTQYELDTRKEREALFLLLLLLLSLFVSQAVSEGVLIEPQLNRVFVKLLLRRPCRLDDIKSLDASLHRSLILLKKYPGDAADLSLTFSVMRSEFGSQEEVDLIPNGRNIPVTK